MKRPVITMTTKGPISSVSLIDEPTVAPHVPQPDPDILSAERKRIQEAAKAVKQAAEQIETAGREIFSSHREAVIQLAMEVAAKILARDIEEKNYQIEQILQEALREIPTGQIRTIRMHPEDLELYQQSLKEHPENVMPHVHLIGDWALGHAECIIETEQGILDWLIEEQVRQVSEALSGHNAK